MTVDINKAISIAKIHLMQHKSTMFVATVCCSLDTQVDEEVAYAATNGKVIKINPITFMELTPDERVFLLAHETMHVVYKHMLRLGDREHVLWNAATDYLINGQLVEQGFIMIEGGLINPEYDGLSADEIYEIIYKDPQGGAKAESNVLDGDLEELPEEMTAEEIADMEEDINNVLVSATQICDMRGDPGSVPGDVRRYLEKLAAPKVNWKVVLRRYMQALDRSDYSWSRPNKRYYDMYLPHMRGEALGQISFAIDTSGSVSLSDFNQFISEVHTVMKTLKPKSLHLMQFDHALQSSDIVKNLRELSQVKFKGHGGTNPSVALNAFIESPSVALIMITDGQFYTDNLPKPRRPVLWVIFDNPNFEAPFGKVIHITMKK